MEYANFTADLCDYTDFPSLGGYSVSISAISYFTVDLYDCTDIPPDLVTALQSV